MIKVEFRLKNSEVRKLSLKSDDKCAKGKTKFEYSPIFNDTDAKSFAILYKIDVCTDDCRMKLSYVSYFETTDDITEEQKTETDFFTVNAPAIGYAFFRAYISNLMLSSGYTPLMLPPLNFVRLGRKSKEKMIAKKETELLEKDSK